MPVLADDPALSSEQRWRLVSSLFDQTRSMAEGGLALLLVQFVCGVQARSPIFAALGCITAFVTAFRIFEAHRFARMAGPGVAQREGTPDKWSARFVRGTLTTAFLWPVTLSAALEISGDASLAMLVIMVQAGWITGAAVRNAVSPMATGGAVLLVLGSCAFNLAVSQGGFLRWVIPFLIIQISATLSIARYLRAHVLALMLSEQRLEALNLRLAQLSATDGLTGIGNRRAFDSALQAEWTRAARNGQLLSLLMIDVDYFKRFNDHYGHPAGDECLRRIAELIDLTLRRPPDFAARFGGEEFAVLLPGTDLDGARDVAERIRQAIRDANLSHALTECGAVTVSIGCASVRPKPHTDAQLLIDLADAALYEAKQAGRNRVCCAAELAPV